MEKRKILVGGIFRRTQEIEGEKREGNEFRRSYSRGLIFAEEARGGFRSVSETRGGSDPEGKNKK